MGDIGAIGFGVAFDRSEFRSEFTRNELPQSACCPTVDTIGAQLPIAPPAHAQAVRALAQHARAPDAHPMLAPKAQSTENRR